MDQTYKFPGNDTSSGGTPPATTAGEGSDTDDDRPESRASSNGHDRNLSAPSNSTIPKDGAPKPTGRPTRAATYSRPHMSRAPDDAPLPMAAAAPPPLTSDPQRLVLDEASKSKSTNEKDQQNEERNEEEGDDAAPNNDTSISKQQSSKASDPKTPSEYALHILFTQVSFLTRGLYDFILILTIYLVCAVR